MSNKVNIMDNAYGADEARPTTYESPNEPNKAPVIDNFDAEMAKIDGALYREYAKRVEILNTYLALTEDASNMSDESIKLVTFAKLSFGLRKAGEALSWATFHQKSAYAARKEAEGLAALEDFSEYVNKKSADGEKVKVTNDMRNYYIPVNPRVLLANRREALANAIYEHISTIRAQFIQGISTLRSLSYGVKDSNYMSSSAVAFNERSF